MPNYFNEEKKKKKKRNEKNWCCLAPHMSQPKRGRARERGCVLAGSPAHTTLHWRAPQLCITYCETEVSPEAVDNDNGMAQRSGDS